MNINKTDVIWNYIATFLKIASSVLLLPLILNYLSPNEVGIWTIFSSISALVFLLDFGFHSTFVRNVSYVFSGVQILEKEGLTIGVNSSINKINYSLLKDIISAMKWFYTRISILLLLVLLIVGTPYIKYLIKGYKGDIIELQVAWILFCFVTTYNLYTLYFDSLLEGKGLIKLSKQISIIGNVIYILIASLLVFLDYGLIAVIVSQLFSLIIVRMLSFKFFFTKKLKMELDKIQQTNHKNVLNTISPNALKYGVTSLGGFMIQRSSIFIGSIFLPLISIASFGITRQLIEILVVVANVTLATYIPKLAKLRVESDINKLKSIFIKGILVSNFIFICGSLFLIFFGQIVLKFINSGTNLVPIHIMIAMLISSFIGLNSGISGSVLATKNKIPFMLPSIYSGIATIFFLLFIFKFSNLGLFGMAIAPGLIDLCYQGWKWPLEVISEFNIKFIDIKLNIKELIDRIKNYL